MENNEGVTQYDEALVNAVEVFSIAELDALDVRTWIKTTTDLGALEALYEVCGESEMQIAYVCHLLQERMKELA